MKGCNQVAHADVPHPVRLTCQNASLMTERLLRLRRTIRGGKAQNQAVLHVGTLHIDCACGEQVKPDVTLAESL